MSANTDNTQLSPAQGLGDKIRDIAKVQGDGSYAKTQAVVFDAGGSGVESLVTSANPLPINNNLLATAQGQITGQTVVHKFGSNPATGTTLTPVTAAGVYPTPTTPVSLEFVSSAVGDALNGAGMWELTIYGLNSTWNEQITAVAANATNGQTPVAIPGTWLRVYRAIVTKSGSYANSTTGSHVGTITVRIAGDGATWAQIPLINSFPVGRSLIGCYTIPINFTGYIYRGDVSVDAVKNATIALFTRANANVVSSPYTGTVRINAITAGVSGAFSLAENFPLGPFVGPCDLGYMASVNTGTGTVSVEFEIVLVPS